MISTESTERLINVFGSGLVIDMIEKMHST